MPSGDKFCPNCGRSMFGMPNPNLIHPAPAPRPAKSKTPVVVLVVIIVLIAIAAVIFFVTKGNAAEINFDGLSQVVSNTEQTLFNAPAEHFIS